MYNIKAVKALIRKYTNESGGECTILEKKIETLKSYLVKGI